MKFKKTIPLYLFVLLATSACAMHPLTINGQKPKPRDSVATLDTSYQLSYPATSAPSCPGGRLYIIKHLYVNSVNGVSVGFGISYIQLLPGHSYHIDYSCTYRTPATCIDGVSRRGEYTLTVPDSAKGKYIRLHSSPVFNGMSGCSVTGYSLYNGSYWNKYVNQ